MSRAHEIAAVVAKHGGNKKAAADALGINPSNVTRAMQKIERDKDIDPAIQSGMVALGAEMQPQGAWVKNSTPDEMGRTYSFYMNLREEREEQSVESRMAAIEDRFRTIPRVKLPIAGKLPSFSKATTKAFISINDLHAGSLAWGRETGYGDWDLDIALKRLTDWTARLLQKIKGDNVDEIILYYNGDTLHSNGDIPMTGTQGTNHILDTDSRQFKTVDLTAESIIVTGDLAAQSAPHVRLVIKRGNHDSDSYLALLQAAKWRYHEQANVTVEMDPNPYWAHAWDDVLLFGHHGDKIKPERMIMTMADKHREAWGKAKHVTMWTGDKHHRKVEQFPGVVWEQASCWTESDLYGSHYGNNAMAQCVIYNGKQGETARYTVKDLAKE